MQDFVFSRRRLLVGAGVLAGGVMAIQGVRPPSARAEGSAAMWDGASSLNGWPIVDAVQEYVIEGSNELIGACSDDVATILCNVARRYNYEVHQLLASEVGSFQTDRAVAAPYESNYLSGTAITLRAGSYPIGSTGDLLDPDVIIIRDILTQHQGVVSWGGDFDPVKQSHFEISVAPDDPSLAQVASSLRSQTNSIGETAGSIDAFDPQRIAESEEFAEEQGIPD